MPTSVVHLAHGWEVCRMDLEENAIWVGIYVGESDSFGNIPAYKAVVHYLREHGSWGATVTWGV